jgi:hypothetical protein
MNLTYFGAVSTTYPMRLYVCTQSGYADLERLGFRSACDHRVGAGQALVWAGDYRRQR